jgi:hypothetical protein
MKFIVPVLDSRRPPNVTHCYLCSEDPRACGETS